jgi:ribonuclease HII
MQRLKTISLAAAYGARTGVYSISALDLLGMNKNKPTFSLESSAWAEDRLFAACDEAGFGTAAGSMWIAATIWPKNSIITPAMSGIKDSKKTTAEQRKEAVKLIKDSCQWFLWEVTAEQINNGNPYWLRYEAADAGLDHLEPLVTCFDGNVCLKNSKHRNTCQVKGDSVSISIAAASIIAKHAKDLECKELHRKYPEYGFINHSGYLTEEHIKALKTFGPAPCHRSKYISAHI